MAECGQGDISTHVISKLGSSSVAGSHVALHFNPDLNASCFEEGWTQIADERLSDNGGHDVSALISAPLNSVADTSTARPAQTRVVYADLRLFGG